LVAESGLEPAGESEQVLALAQDLESAAESDPALALALVTDLALDQAEDRVQDWEFVVQAGD